MRPSHTRAHNNHRRSLIIRTLSAWQVQQSQRSRYVGGWRQLKDGLFRNFSSLRKYQEQGRKGIDDYYDGGYDNNTMHGWLQVWPPFTPLQTMHGWLPARPALDPAVDTSAPALDTLTTL